eukprot:33067-Eustigmatos_ZCMA.PRE.1
MRVSHSAKQCNQWLMCLAFKEPELAQKQISIPHRPRHCGDCTIYMSRLNIQLPSPLWDERMCV